MPLNLPKYKSHKVVSAAQIVEVYHNAVVLVSPDGKTHWRIHFEPAMAARYFPSVGDYLVEYEDGYQSFSPQKAFEEGYSLCQ